MNIISVGVINNVSSDTLDLDYQIDGLPYTVMFKSPHPDDYYQGYLILVDIRIKYHSVFNQIKSLKLKHPHVPIVVCGYPANADERLIAPQYIKCIQYKVQYMEIDRHDDFQKPGRYLLDTYIKKSI